ncbi:MAG: enoyl-CoA hydratase/isomerase family protein [Alphaproteobacteria bacterium]
MDFKDCTFSVTDGVALFTLNMPDQRNALTENMFTNDLPNLIKRVSQDTSIGAVILTGAGGVFCAGGNIKGMKTEKTPWERNTSLQAYQRMTIDLANLPVPVIAAVDGAAYGAGFSLALAADFIMASTRARFCNAFGRVGLVPDLGMFYFLPRIVGVPRAKELTYTARSFTAAEAKELGLVLSVHSPETLIAEARKMAARLTKASRVSIQLSKEALNQSLSQDFDTMMAIERAGQAQARMSAFHKEAVARFLDKKAPLYDWDQMDKKAAE